MAGSLLSAKVQVEGLQPLLKKLSGIDPIFAQPWRTALGKATSVARAAVTIRAPRKTGGLAGSITSRLDAKPVPQYGIVTASASSAAGFRYPFALEAGKGRKLRGGGNAVTHYRSGARKGRLTKRWFKGSLAAVRPLINGILHAAATQIEARWAR